MVIKFLLLLSFCWSSIKSEKKYFVHHTDVHIPYEAALADPKDDPEFDFEHVKEFYESRKHPLFSEDYEYFTCDEGCESIDQLMIDYGRLVTIENETMRAEKAEEAEQIKKKIQSMHPKFGTPEFVREDRTSFHNTKKWV